MGGVEVWRGGLGAAYLLPTLSSVGASRAPPCFRFHTPLIEPFSSLVASTAALIATGWNERVPSSICWQWLSYAIGARSTFLC